MTTWGDESRRHRGHRQGGGAARRLVAALQGLAFALQEGDASDVAVLLDARATLVVDTGGLVPAPASPISGRDAVAAALAEVAAAHEDASFAAQQVNGLPGLAIRADGRIVGIVVGALRRRRIADIWIVLNPQKLRHWNR
jgi:RNA polymerase sigma-70 factor (ECF subfamily)